MPRKCLRLNERRPQYNLVVSAIVHWNTVYLSRAVAHLRQSGRNIPDNVLKHVSPLSWEHINLTGIYTWDTASELIKMKPGERRLSESYPWVVAFAFGLLHGFGFAGALMEIGLPQSDMPLSLLTFNLGVEAGQLIFVGAALVVLQAAGALSTIQPAPACQFGAYIIGTAAMLWLVSRIAGLAA